ncbi:MAG TPA: hypothetical protein PK760_03565 [Flavobacteriales bacterium]|nr:hypothetical protein [Flavobacteriales bacterium]
MHVRATLVAGLLVVGMAASAQEDVIKRIELGEFVVHAQSQGFDLEGFMHQVMEDTTFYHAFLNTRFFPHTVSSVLSVHNKKDLEMATLFRRGRLVRDGVYAELVLDTVSERGKLRDRQGGFRFLTAEMYDDVFFPEGKYVASNRIADRTLELDRSSRFEKYKSELKKFMFNPGQEIASVPMVGDKLDIFEPSIAKYYDYRIDSDVRGGHTCWKFTAVAKDSLNNKPVNEDRTVIKRMVTWFDMETMNVIAREYRIAHASLFLDFDISIRVDNTITDGELVPMRVDYNGDWDIPFKNREIVWFRLDYTFWKVKE